jgi:hypothetical protein
MAYTIGTSHGPFSGIGSFVIAKPVGIRTVVTGIPSYTGHDASIPPRFFRLGRYTLGNIHGFQNSVPIEYEQQVAYPIAPDWELLAYDIRDGASCTFYELVAVPDLTAKQPWDRAPLAVAAGGPLSISGSTSDTTCFSYVVPAGRKLALVSARVRLLRLSAAGPLGATQAYMSAAGANVLFSYSSINTIGTILEDALQGGPLMLSTGQIVRGGYSSTDTGGSWNGTFVFSGFLFDA